MKYETEKNDLIFGFRIQKQIETAFKTILEKNTVEELDIENKNVSIDSQKIEYSQTDFDNHRFQTQIFDEKNRHIGYFAIIVSNSNERIDEYFVIK
jgi:hypothetical protein